MTSKNKVKLDTGSKGAKTRPFTIFYVNPKTPKEVHTDTIMASDANDAMDAANRRHSTSTILHVRPIGAANFPRDPESPGNSIAIGHTTFPGARFIHGKFHPETFTDDLLLEALLDKA